MKKLNILALSLLISVPAMAAEKKGPFDFWRDKEAKERTVYQDPKSGSKITQKPDGTLAATVETSRPGYPIRTTGKNPINLYIKLDHEAIGRGPGTQDNLLAAQAASEREQTKVSLAEDEDAKRKAKENAALKMQAQKQALRAQQAATKAAQQKEKEISEFRAEQQKRRDASDAQRQKEAAKQMEQDIQAQEKAAQKAAKQAKEQEKQAKWLAKRSQKAVEQGAAWVHEGNVATFDQSAGEFKWVPVAPVAPKAPASQGTQIVYGENQVSFTTATGAKTMFTGNPDEIKLKAQAALENPYLTRQSRDNLFAIVAKPSDNQ